MYPHKIIYVEDDETDFERMRDGIDQSKFEVMGEANGDKALERLQDDKTYQTIKAVLLDAVELVDPVTHLPQRLQGEDVARRIREIRPGLPVFAVSWFRHGGLNVPVDGVYPKSILFTSPDTFKDLEEALTDAILKMDTVSFYPDDGGGARWRFKWGPEYIEFRNNPTYSAEEVKVSRRARQDYDSLADGGIHETYRRYRGTDTLKKVLIARRVIFAAVFSNYRPDSGVVWKEVGNFLGFKFPEGEESVENEMHEGLRNFMNECGLKWGNIINRATILREEEEWLEREEFLS